MATRVEPYNPGMSSSEGSACESMGFEPGTALQGEACVQGSKSIALRALVAAALADGRTVIEGLPDGEDVRAGIELARALRARVEALGLGSIAVQAHERRGPWPETLEVGESGTLARFATALAGFGLGPPRVMVGGRGTLLARKSEPLLSALERAGATPRPLGPSGSWPLEIGGASVPAEIELVDPISSQEISALLIAASACPHHPRLVVRGTIPSRPYLGITIGVLQRFGARVDERRLDSDEVEFQTEGALRAPPEQLAIEPDASLAAIALAAACLSRGEIRVRGFATDSFQGDLWIAEHLCAFGCDARREGDAIVAGGSPTRGASVDLEDTPDLAPVLAAVAAGAAQASGEWSELTGLDTLSRKESARVAVLAEGLGRAGWRVEGGTSSLRIGPPRSARAGTAVLDPHGDHRMAFAFALLGLLRPGIRVSNPGCVAKTWPSFWEDFEALGVRVERTG